MAHFEDYELAQSIHRELLELRGRANSATSVELSVIAAKAESPTIKDAPGLVQAIAGEQQLNSLTVARPLLNRVEVAMIRDQRFVGFFVGPVAHYAARATIIGSCMTDCSSSRLSRSRRSESDAPAVPPRTSRK